jgi:hypothetical protein
MCYSFFNPVFNFHINCSLFSLVFFFILHYHSLVNHFMMPKYFFRNDLSMRRSVLQRFSLAPKVYPPEQMMFTQDAPCNDLYFFGQSSSRQAFKEYKKIFITFLLRELEDKHLICEIVFSLENHRNSSKLFMCANSFILKSISISEIKYDRCRYKLHYSSIGI